MDIYNEYFGSWAKQKLKENHMTQSELAKRLKISKPYLSDILKGNRFAKKARENMVIFFSGEDVEGRYVVDAIQGEKESRRFL